MRTTSNGPGRPAMFAVVRASGVFAVVLAAVLAARVASSSAQPRSSFGQYLVIVDDSSATDTSDPRRLAVLASLGLTGALDDGDQVMLVGLDELATGGALAPRFVSPRELLDGRDGPEGTRPLADARFGALARHHGQRPCRAALTIARDLLNGVSRAGAAQTLVLLTSGACDGPAVDRAEAFLGGVSSLATRHFRFVLLTRDGRGRVDPELERYARLTGWDGEPRLPLDAPSVLRAFAAAVSFGRGLRLDDGGRVGAERTFAGARGVRVLALRDGGGAERIELVRTANGIDAPISTGPTWVDPEHRWSLRIAREQARSEPYGVRSSDDGVSVVVVPAYGQLHVEAIVTTCDGPPPRPWDYELPARAGEPVCAWARLVGDTRETVVRGQSFDFDLDVCDDAACVAATAMVPAADGTWSAHLGALLGAGRHERFFRAGGSALAAPILARVELTALVHGVRYLARTEAPAAPVTELDLGTLPRATPDALSLVVHGVFAPGARAHVRCEPEGDFAAARCVRCVPEAGALALRDGAALRVRVLAEPFCQPVSDDQGRDMPVRVHLVLDPSGSAAADVGRYELPMRAVLRYGATTPAEVRITGGSSEVAVVSVPAPVARVPLRVTFERGRAPAGLELERDGSGAIAAGRGGLGALRVRITTPGCCTAGRYPMTIVLAPPSGAPLHVPVVIDVADGGWLVCRGRAVIPGGAVLALLLVAWILRGPRARSKRR